MYHVMVNAVSSEAPRMSLATGVNRWASRAVVVLQLAAWSAVGIVLLHKGISSLQKTSEARNTTMVNTTHDAAAVLTNGHPDGRSDSEVIEASVIAVRGNVPVHDDEQLTKTSKNVDERFFNRADSAELLTEFQNRKAASNKILAGYNQRLNVLEDTEMQTRSQEHERFLKENNPESSNKRNERMNTVVQEDDESKNVLLGIKEEEVTDVPNRISQEPSPSTNTGDLLDLEERQQDFPSSPTLSTEAKVPKENSTNGDVGSTMPKSSGKQDSSWEKRRRMRVSQFSGGGAAAAVAMVAVGALMLILGPAVILLRALDERRQERRFLKLSGQDDLPPSYEQATLMDEAPRYSTLSLNTIYGPPPPPSPCPSPTPTRVQLS